jgi:hypothetical protein
MTTFATCAGQPIVAGSLMIPLIGAWTADLHLATDTPVSGAVQIVIGNLTLNGFVYRAEPYAGQVRVRVVAGFGGWRTMVTDQGYGSSSGVKLSHVLGDVANACGEQINLPTDATIGNAYTRADAPASDVLWQMVAQGFIPAWYIAPSGVTQAAAWPVTTVGTSFTVIDQKPDEGLVVIATEDYASWMPGSTFTNPLLTGSYTNSGVTYVFDNEGTFRFEVLTGTVDRILGPLQQLIARQLAPTRFYGRYAYTISNPTQTTVDGSPVNSVIGLPDLQGVPIAADSISTYTPPDGGACHIMFLDGIPTQPICVWTEGTASVVNLLGGSNPVARLGDQVQCFLPPTLPISGSLATPPSLFTGLITVANPISGSITQGSSDVNAS